MLVLNIKIEKIHLQTNALLTYITTLSGGFLVTNWLAREQQMLRDIVSLFSADSIQNPRN